MSTQTNIAYCDATWNWIIGCTKVSPGCIHCYAEQSTPSRTLGIEWGDKAERRVASDATFNAPLKWNKKPWVCNTCGHADSRIKSMCIPPREKPMPYLCTHCGELVHRRRVFSLSLGDWLDPKIPVSVLARAMDIIRRCPDLDFLLLTKRPQLFFSRMSDVSIYRDIAGNPIVDVDWVNAWACRNKPPHNVWVGTSVEDQQRADERIPELLKIPAKVRFLSIEPLLEDLGNLNLATTCDTKNCQHYTEAECPGTEWKCIMQSAIDWVIVGGESGPKARPCNVEWIRSIVRDCKAGNVPCFVKQLGHRVWDQDKDVAFELCLKHPKGGDPSEWPNDLRVQEFPKVGR